MTSRLGGRGSGPRLLSVLDQGAGSDALADRNIKAVWTREACCGIPLLVATSVGLRRVPVSDGRDRGGGALVPTRWSGCGRLGRRRGRWRGRRRLRPAPASPPRWPADAVPGLVLDMDASIVICHSEKESATPTWKHTFGYHPLFCFLDNTREALSGMLREGRAGSNTTADHITVLDQALAQIPDAHGTALSILVRPRVASPTSGPAQRGVDAWFSVGVAITEPIRQAITAMPGTAWVPALDTDGELRDGAEVCEMTGLVAPTGRLPDRHPVHRAPRTPAPRRPTVPVRHHRRHAPPGHRHRHPTPAASIQFLEARHRAHARVEDRIRCGKDTGFGRFPSRVFAINAAWLELALTGIDLLAWTQALLLDGELAAAEPKKLRYRLLHVAARITRTARRTRLRIADTWPWADQLAAAFARLHALPLPAT